jgi:hypothetical protein
MLHTVEERIQDVLARKRALFDSVFSDAIAAPSSGLSREEIFALFNLDSHGQTRLDAA